ncbi:aspartate/glutamate racemase family protein [[Eubacterium] cellulosolvens]
MRVKIINPTTTGVFDAETEKEFAGYAFPGTQVSVSHLAYGPASIECELDEAICVPDFLKEAKQAEAEGYDVVISDCFGDPAVKPAREVLNIPVVGAAEASMHFAASLGHRFSVVTVLPNVVPLIENLAAQYGVDKKLGSVRNVNIPVLDLRDRKKLVNALHREMLAAIKEDHAHVLVLGCTGMMGVAKEVEKRLKRDGYDVPVIDAVAASLKFAESLVSMGLKQSRLTFMPPPKKARPGFS